MTPQEWATDYGLRCIARHRELGLHFFGHLLGISAVSADSEVTVLRMDPPAPPGDSPRTSPTMLATLADLAMSVVIRRRLADVVRLGTATLSVRFIRPVYVGAAIATAYFVTADENPSSAHAYCDVRDANGELVATADAWFVVLPLPPDRSIPRQRWEMGETLQQNTDVPYADLGERDRACIEALSRAGDTTAAVGTPLVEALLGLGCETSNRVSLNAGPALTNRVGNIQGGALFGIGLNAAQRMIDDGARLVSGHVQYLAVTPEGELHVESELLRQGRRASFVHVAIANDSRQLIDGQFTFGTSPDTHAVGS